MKPNFGARKRTACDGQGAGLGKSAECAGSSVTWKSSTVSRRAHNRPTFSASLKYGRSASRTASFRAPSAALSAALRGLFELGRRFANVNQLAMIELCCLLLIFERHFPWHATNLFFACQMRFLAQIRASSAHSL